MPVDLKLTEPGVVVVFLDARVPWLSVQLEETRCRRNRQHTYCCTPQ